MNTIHEGCQVPDIENKQKHGLEALLDHMDFYVDDNGSCHLTHIKTGSKIVFTHNGDIKIYPKRDADIKSGRWVLLNSIQEKVTKLINGG